MKVRGIMTANPACCSPEDTNEGAARMMEQKDSGCARDIAVRAVGIGHACTGRDDAVAPLLRRGERRG